jgi:hypothetical protein
MVSEQLQLLKKSRSTWIRERFKKSAAK